MLYRHIYLQFSLHFPIRQYFLYLSKKLLPRCHCDQFANGAKTINDRLSLKDKTLSLCEWLRQKGVEKLCEIL